MAICKRCNEEVAFISSKGLCQECSCKAMLAAARQMEAHDGPYYKNWLSSRQKAVATYRAKMEKAIKNYDEAFGALEHLATPVGQAEMITRIGHLTDALGEDYLDEDEDEEDR